MRMELEHYKGKELTLVEGEGWVEDEGEAVGSEKVEEGKRKVKVGRGLGVGALVERNEAAN